jgi:glycerol-3-phosphate acyltransferase PlsY
MATNQRADHVLPLRKLIHLAGAAFPLLYLIAPRQIVLLAASIALIFTLVVEWGRQRWPAVERFFEQLIGPALREGEERQLTTGVWSMLGILVSVALYQREYAIPAMFFAHLGDPAAEIVGHKWGRHQMPSGKSLEGSLGCFIVSAAIGMGCTQLLPLSPGIALFGALIATLTEATPLPIGDNLLMAPLAGLAMTLGAFITG